MVFIVYVDRANQWRWYLRAANGRKIADSGEGYLNYQDCLGGIQLVKLAHSAPVQTQ